MARGRKKLVLDRAEFQAVINELESRQNFNTRSELCMAIEETDFAKRQKPRPLTWSVAMARIKDMGIECKTQNRQRKQKLSSPCVTSERMSSHSKTFRLLEKEYPAYKSLIARAAKGSLRAVIKLKCLDCTCGQKREIKYCQCFACPLYPQRPFQ